MRSTRPTTDASTGSIANSSSETPFSATIFSKVFFSVCCVLFATLSFTFSVFPSVFFLFKLGVAHDPGVTLVHDVSLATFYNLSIQAEPLNLVPFRVSIKALTAFNTNNNNYIPNTCYSINTIRGVYLIPYLQSIVMTSTLSTK